MRLGLVRQIVILSCELTAAQSKKQPRSLFGRPSEEFSVEGHAQVVDDKVVLTSINKGNQQGAIWFKNKDSLTEWSFETHIKTAGPASPGGGLAIWFTDHVYTKGTIYGFKDKWDGLALMLDSVSSYTLNDNADDDDRGTLRAHLNDGSEAFAKVKSPAEHSFAQCPVKYRNTGGPIFIRAQYSLKSGLVVQINGQRCFHTNDVHLPKFSYVGLSASSNMNPDSFSVLWFKFSENRNDLLSEGTQESERHKKLKVKSPHENVLDSTSKPHPEPHVDTSRDELHQQKSSNSERAMIPSEAMTILETLSKQVLIISQRLQIIEESLSGASAQSQLTEVKELLQGHAGISEHKNHLSREILEHRRAVTEEIKRMRQKLDNLDSISKIHSKLDEMRDFSKQLDRFGKQFSDQTTNLLGALPDKLKDAVVKNGPSIWLGIVIMLAVQALVGVSYMAVRSRSSHSKFL